MADGGRGQLAQVLYHVRETLLQIRAYNFPNINRLKLFQYSAGM